MRVISGKVRGTKLNSIDDISTRPTLDRIKENIFNLINIDFQDASVLDLFAGSGALGIECLSRGAKVCYFCDKNKKAIDIIKYNLTKTRLYDKAIILSNDYEKALDKLNERFDLIFLDPPYKSNLVYEALKRILELNMLNENGEIIVETDNYHDVLEEIYKLSHLKILKDKNYGRVSIFILTVV